MIAVFLGWGASMAVIGTIGVLFFGFIDTETPSLLYGTAGLIAVVALSLWLARSDRGNRYSARPLPGLSPPMPLLAVGAIFAALGVELGWWLTLIGAGLAAVALGGLARELRSERRMVREAGPKRSGGGER